MIISKILNVILMSLVFLWTRAAAMNLISKIQDSKWKGRQILRAKAGLSESVPSAICITLVLFLIYEIVRWSLRNKSIGMQSLLTGFIPSGIFFYGLLYTHTIDTR